jgi:curved DNA-binding protein CbpA
MSKSGEFIFSWLQVLDQLTYYELFGVEDAASVDDVRTAFHRFCDTFHPDRHWARPQDERDALCSIFKRGTEAHLVLSDASLREQYDREVRARSSARPPRISYSPRSRPPPSQAPGAFKLEDAVRSPSSRPFARRADELIQAGDLRQAKLQLVMANHLEPQNEKLEAALRDVDEKLFDRNW